METTGITIGLDFSKFGLALVGILLVLIYAKWQKWGRMGIEDRVLGTPGGALTTSPPLWEFIFFWFVPISSATGVMVATIASFFLAERLILNVIGLYAIFLKWTGKIDAQICMDDRTWLLAKKNSEGIKGTNNNHNGLCGAWDTMSLIGFTPGSALVGILLMLGINVPIWLAVILSLPYIFVLGKHYHIVAVQKIGDALHYSELLGWFIGSFPIGLVPKWQQCGYGDKKNSSS